jgi:hypothetical protein
LFKPTLSPNDLETHKVSLNWATQYISYWLVQYQPVATPLEFCYSAAHVYPADKVCIFLTDGYQNIKSGYKLHSRRVFIIPNSQTIIVIKKNHFHLLYNDTASTTQNNMMLFISSIFPPMSIVNRYTLANTWNRNICVLHQESKTKLNTVVELVNSQ